MIDPLVIPVFPILQPIGNGRPFYSGVVKAKKLVSICKFDFRRIKERGGYKDFLGIQRPLSDKRVEVIKRYLGTFDACFPASIVISVDSRCAHFDDKTSNLTLQEFISDEKNGIKIPYADIATIIDGQHRLKPFEDPLTPDMDVIVTVFVGIDDATEAQIFSKVNLAQTKVNRSLAYDLFALDKVASPEKLAHEIVVSLDKMKESPFQGKIKRLGVATEDRYGETLSQSTIVQGIMPYLSKDPMGDRDNSKRYGFYPEVKPKDKGKLFLRYFMEKNKDEIILALIINYFNAVKQKWPEAWASTGQGIILGRTNGYNALMRFFFDSWNHITTSPRVVKQDEFFKIFEPINWEDAYFDSRNFKPGSSGAAQLYRELKEVTGI